MSTGNYEKGLTVELGGSILPIMSTGPHIRSDRLRHYRRVRVLSTRQLAELAGISITRVYEFENGRNSGTRPETAQALAKALDCPISELIEIVDEIPA